MRTRLVCLENTHNRGAGRIQPYDVVESICDWAHAIGLATHLDGARLFNAVRGHAAFAAARWAAAFRHRERLLQQGAGRAGRLGPGRPARSDQTARRHRKLFGGGMRQAGVMAAAALYALEHHIDRLADDHANAQRLADAIRQIDGLELSAEQVDTNIVIFRVEPRLGTAAEFCARLKQRGLLMLADRRRSRSAP